MTPAHTFSRSGAFSKWPSWAGLQPGACRARGGTQTARGLGCICCSTEVDVPVCRRSRWLAGPTDVLGVFVGLFFCFVFGGKPE